MRLAELRAKGEGVVKDELGALATFNQFCKDGYAGACAQAGFAYIAGRGTPADSEHGIKLLKQACLGGEAIACRLVKNPLTLKDLDSALRAAAEAEIACERDGRAGACAGGRPP